MNLEEGQAQIAEEVADGLQLALEVVIDQHWRNTVLVHDLME